MYRCGQKVTSVGVMSKAITLLAMLYVAIGVPPSLQARGESLPYNVMVSTKVLHKCGLNQPRGSLKTLSSFLFQANVQFHKIKNTSYGKRGFN